MIEAASITNQTEAVPDQIDADKYHNYPKYTHSSRSLQGAKNLKYDKGDGH